jgi:hypothetical protein
MVLLEMVDAEGDVSGVRVAALFALETTLFLFVFLAHAAHLAPLQYFGRVMAQLPVEHFLLHLGWLDLLAFLLRDELLEEA